MMMKTVVLNAPGDIDNFSVKEMPVPVPGDNEVLVQVKAIAVNPVDVKTRKGGSLFASLQEEAPVILGWDISGVVQSVGKEVQRFKSGDEVFGMVNFPGHGKAYAEFVAAPEEHLALKPANISHGEAAAATLAALTAWQVLVHQAGIQRGQHLLMHAAAGGVGHFAVQIAKHLGARVTGTASGYNEGFLKEMGVDVFLDYNQQDITEAVNDVDLVFDPLGGDTTEDSLRVLKPGGTIISIVGGVKENIEALAKEKNVAAKNYLVHSNGQDMEQLAELLKTGKIKPHISHEFGFDEIGEAHRQIETGKTRGKVIINVL